MIVPQSITEYIRAAQAQGAGRQEIEKSLLAVGWQPADIAAGFTEAVSASSSPVVPVQPASASVEAYPRAILQDFALNRIVAIVQCVLLLVFFYAFWKSTAAEATGSAFAALAWITLGINALVLVSNQVFYLLVPVHNPMFAALAYINYFQGRDLSLREVARLCRQKMLEFAAFQVHFAIDFFSESLRTFSDNTQNQKLLNNKGVIYAAKLYSFLLGVTAQESMKQIADKAGQESATLFRIHKLSVKTTIRIASSIFVTLAILIFLLNIGVLNMFAFFPVFIVTIIAANVYFNLKPFMDAQQKLAMFYFGLISDRQYLERLKGVMPASEMKPRLLAGFLGLLGSLLLLYVLVVFFAASPALTGALVSIFILAFGFLVRQILIQQMYFGQAALGTAPSGNAEEDKVLQDTKSYLGINATLPQAMRLYYKSLAVVFAIAVIPGLNLAGAVMALHTIIHQKMQVLTKAEFANNHRHVVLLLLGTIALVPLFGSLFALIGFGYSLALRRTYKPAS